jgi:hypothetical protein
MSTRRLGSLLGRWHQWRRAYSHERGYARPARLLRDEQDEDDLLERLTMSALEDHITRLPGDLQLALQHVARAECLGVEVIMNPRLGDKEQRTSLVERALAELERKLLHAGVL